MTPMLFRESVARTALVRVPSATPAGESEGMCLISELDCAPSDGVISTREALNSGFVKPEVSPIVPAPGAFASDPGLPALCCARTKNHVTANAIVYAALMTESRQ